MHVTLTKSFDFHAAHALGTFPQGHRCRQMHGHTFRVDVVVSGDVDPRKGYLVDFGEIRKLTDPIQAKLDHTTLNDIPGLEVPTAEMIAKWVYDQLAPNLPQLEAIRIHETPNNTAEYRGE